MELGKMEIERPECPRKDSNHPYSHGWRDGVNATVRLNSAEDKKDEKIKKLQNEVRRLKRQLKQSEATVEVKDKEEDDNSTET